MSSSVTKQVLILVKQQGLDQANTAIKGLATTSQAATKSTDALGSSWNKSQTGAVKMTSSVTKLDQSEGKAAKSTDMFAKSTDKAGKSTTGLAAKFQGNKGLIFATVGIATAGLEAVGMFQMYQNAAGKVSEAQDRLNQLERAGLKDTQAYTNAQRDLTDANRGAQFALRILTLSVGDLIPFTLLLINSGVKLKTTIEGTKGAMDTAAAGATALGGATKAAASGGLTQMFNSAGQVVGGMKGLDTSVRTASTATGTLYTSSGQLVTQFGNVGRTVQDNTRFIGTRSNGLVGGVSALTVGMNESNKMSTKFREAFRQIGDHIKSLPGIFKNIGSSVAGFFTNFGTHLGKLPGLFKAAGVAVMGFGKAMLAAFVSNPILLIIAAIATAVIALIGNFGGFRDAVNSVGIAIGNAIPQLKGVLQWFGDMANGALDAVAGFLGFETSSKKAGNAAAETKLKMDPLLISLQKYIDLGPQFSKLNEVVDMFAKVRTEIVNLTETQESYIAKSTVGLEAVRSAFETSFGSVPVTSEKAKAAIQAVYNAIEILRKGNFTAAQSQKFLTIAIDAASAAIGEEVNATKEDVAAKQRQEQATANLTGATKGLSNETASVLSLFAQQQASQNKSTQETDKNAEAVVKLADKYGIVIPEIDAATVEQDAFLKSLYDAAPAFDIIEEHLDLASGKVIDYGNVLISMAGEHEVLKAKASDLWGTMAAGITTVGEEAFPIVEDAIEILKKKHPELGAIVEEMYKNYRENTVATAEGVFIVNEAEEEQAKTLESTADKVAKKAKELQIYNKIQKLSLQDQQTAIKITEDQTKAENTARLTLQQLATARGLDIEMIGLSNAELFNLINTLELEANTMGDVYAATGKLIDARQQETKAADLETQAAELFLQTLDQTAPVIGMTGKGLLALSKTYDETANATGIAADEVGLWYAQLKKSQAVEQATIQKLLELADTLGIDIPDNAEMTVESLQDVIEAELGMGDAAKKAAEEAKKAFDDLVGNASDAAADLIQEDVIEGDIDDVKDMLEDLGTSIDTIAGKQMILKPFLDSADFEDDIVQMEEILIQGWAEMELASVGGGQGIVDAFTSSMNDHFDGEAPELINHINSIWAQVQANAPAGATGSTLIQMFLQALNQPSYVMQTANSLGAAIPPGIQQGASGLPGVISDITKQGLSMLFGAGAQYNEAGEQIGTETTSGYQSGASTLPSAGQTALSKLLSMYPPTKEKAKQLAAQIGTSTGEGLAGSASIIQNATLEGIVNPTLDTVGQLPTGTQTAIAPIEGVFSTAFLNASIAATGQINMLLADITTSMGFLVVNIGAKLKEVETAWVAHVTQVQTQIQGLIPVFTNLQTSVAANMTAMTTAVGAWIKASTTSIGAFLPVIKTVQTALSTLSTSTKTYMTSMTSAVSNFAKSAATSMNSVSNSTKTANTALSTMSKTVSSAMSSMSSAVSKFASSFSSAMSKVSSQAKSATSAVKALQSAINSLKSKSINIHVGLSGPGAAYLRHGGAFISAEPTGFAAGGKSWVNSKPRKIGGVNISEFGKPELVTVTPLSNPSDPTDKNISLGMSVPKPQPMPSASAIGANPLGNNRGGGQPITVTGNLNVVVKTQNGKVLAQEVQPYLFEGFGGIT